MQPRTKLSSKQQNKTGNEAKRSSGNVMLKLKGKLRRREKGNALHPYLSPTKSKTAITGSFSTQRMRNGQRNAVEPSAALVAKETWEGTKASSTSVKYAATHTITLALNGASWQSDPRV